MKFVVFKGTAGFGDRLQCLLEVIAYSKATGRFLVVDWRDPEWADDPRDSFDAFFDLVGLKHFGLDSFLSLFRLVGREWSVHPRVWREHMEESEFRSWCYKELFTGKDHGTLFKSIADFETPDFDEDVVVYAGTGFRGFRYSDFGHIRANRWLSGFIQDFGRKRGLVRGRYDLLHLRAGSKKWAGGDVALKSLAEKIDAKFPDLDSYLDALWDKYCSQGCDGASHRPLFIISDSAWLAERWIERFACGTYLSHSMDASLSGSGIHQTSTRDLSARGVSRFTVNAECLRDFAVMLNATRVIHDEVSLFSKMAAACASSVHESWLLTE